MNRRFSAGLKPRPSPDAPFQRVAIIGLGLIGGSWGLALRKQGFPGRRVGCDRPEVLRLALAAGAIDQGETNLGAAVAKSDLVILCAPAGEILKLLPPLKELAPPQALITDAGSTKLLICQTAEEIFSGSPLFLGGHPLAGKERSGIENAHAALFEGACYALIPQHREDLEDPRARAFSALVSSLGARLLVTDAVSHDQALAYLSHLPQLLSTGLASLIAEKQVRDSLPLALAASGFRDVTRLAESPYALWRDICATNLKNIQEALDAMIEKLQTLKQHLRDEGLERDFEQALKLREKLRENVC